MTLRNKNTGEVKELPGTCWRIVMGWWSTDDPTELSYSAAEWEEVRSDSH